MCGIGHTRWATQGKPEKRNAHPQLDGPGRVAVVQNGIIENYRTLREQLQAEGVVFCSETDTEVIPHLLAVSWAGCRRCRPCCRGCMGPMRWRWCGPRRRGASGGAQGGAAADRPG
jgi:glutamine phosphoribosylpyrophosphate amidotransferase